MFIMFKTLFITIKTNNSFLKTLKAPIIIVFNKMLPFVDKTITR